MFVTLSTPTRELTNQPSYHNFPIPADLEAQTYPEKVVKPRKFHNVYIQV